MAKSKGVDTVPVEHEGTIGVTWEEYRDRAKRVVGDKTFYVVEWDLAFATEEELWAYYEETVLKERWKLAVYQRYSDGYEPTYTAQQAAAIKYCVSDLLQTSAPPHDKSRVVAEMAAATAAWQDVANVYFVYKPGEDANCTADNASVDFAVIPCPYCGGFYACNKLQWFHTCFSQGAIGVLPVDYDIDLTLWYNAGLTTTGALKHELGHMLGFRHEHPWAPDQGEAPGCGELPDSGSFTGRRLTDYDQLSVMHYPQCGGILGKDYSISAQDGVGARKIYGMPVAWYVATSPL